VEDGPFFKFANVCCRSLNEKHTDANKGKAISMFSFSFKYVVALSRRTYRYDVRFHSQWEEIQAQAETHLAISIPK
jgi:hypothetical protein